MRTRIGPLLVVGIVTACLVAVGLLSLSSEDFVVSGLRGTDVYASYGLPVVRVLAEIAAVICIGSLLFAAFLLPAPQSGELPDAGRAALRTASWAAVLWGVAALLSVPFTLADVYARPLGYIVEFDRLVELAFAVEPTRAWMLTASIAILLAVTARMTVRLRPARVLLAVAVFCLVPVASSGHSSSGGSHDWATASLLIHLVAAALWIGGLVALLTYGRGKGEHLGVTATRFSALALGCWIALAASGAINALIRLRLPEVFTTSYGLLVLAKTAALVALGGFGYVQRKRGVLEVVENGSGRTLMRLAAFEILLMLVTIGLATALSRTPPPRGGIMPETMELKLGYVLNGPPSLLRMAADWRFDLILGTAAIGLAAVYLLAVSRLREPWPVTRSAAWLGGCVAILFATSSGIGRYAPAVFSVEMFTKSLLAIVAPLLLVLGNHRTLFGLGDRVRIHPAIVLTLFSGSFYALYFTGLFEWSLDRPLTHLGTNMWFLVIGYLFFTTIFDVALPIKRAMLLAAAGLHAVFGVLLLTSREVLADQFYPSLRTPWPVNLLEQQHLGGAVTLGFGVSTLLLLALVHLVPRPEPQRVTV
ncbi:putative copper resistance protein D [Kibdelosporangium banguiense]|uniref:Copper resistance protein D n=1 Tax=Kibdelosporangium banguiense TaxID=1365924 RepID=A0ABS4TP93_9PSEU|nr:cytochrome c oxidase assembly protein [Kibdelosporangium banguiense]MBP2326232.1 putative copper resistance protein D [Kibdelosporangium banguiense]